MDRFFLVDFENVGCSALSNCNGLNKTDHLIIFFTNNANKIDLNIINEHGGAELKTVRVPAKSQSIDMHIVSYMGYLIGKNKGKNVNIIVVSKDKDYDNIIEFWKTTENANVSRVQRIEISYKKKTETTKKSNQVNNSKPKKAPSKSEIKSELNKQIQKVMSENGYAQEAISLVAKIVTKQYGKDNFKQNVHNELRKVYTDYEDIYKHIKPLLGAFC